MWIRGQFSQKYSDWINLNTNFLNAAANFLSCRVKDKMFSFLGIPIRPNPKRVATWKPLLEKGRAIFSCWKCRIL